MSPAVSLRGAEGSSRVRPREPQKHCSHPSPRALPRAVPVNPQGPQVARLQSSGHQHLSSAGLGGADTTKNWAVAAYFCGNKWASIIPRQCGGEW